MPNLEKEDSQLIWKDKTGTYKLGYSQRLMREQIRWDDLWDIPPLPNYRQTETYDH